MWAASQPYMTTRVAVKFVPTDRTDEGFEWYGKHARISSIVPMGHVMTTAPIILLLESVEFKNGKRRSIVEVLGRRWPIVCSSLIFFSFSNSTLMERRAALQRIIPRLVVVLLFTKRILWALYLVALLVTLGKNHDEPLNVLHLCSMFIFFTSFLDQPFHFLAFHHLQCGEDNYY